MALYLQHANGDDRDKVETFEVTRVRVGRNADNDLTFDAEAARLVSRYHAEIYLEGERYFVKDLDSRNGTFVGGRRIDQPTALADGDLIQFAAGGPTVRFSIRPADSTAAHSPAVQETPRAPSGSRPWRRIAIVLGVAVAIAAVVGVTVGYLWSSWWVGFGGFVGAAALESVVLFVWTWWRGRRERAAARIASGAPSPRAGSDTRRELAERWAEGVAALRQSDLKQVGEGAIYALPWYLVLGGRGSGRTATVRAARPLSSSPASRRSPGPTSTCDWWFFEQCVVLDVAGRYLSQTDEATDGGEWQSFLGLLRRTRRREPLNGVIVAVTVDELAGRQIERLQEYAGRVRRRLDEMGRDLGLIFPVYLLVTRLDAMAGFTTFFGRLPAGAVDQAMGALSQDRGGATDAGAVAQRAVRTVAARLEALRLGLLNEADAATAADSAGVFLFVEEFKTLERPLRAFADTLFRQGPYHETPVFRGIYFSSTVQHRAGASQIAARMGIDVRPAAGDASAKPFFARHLFTQVLPAERTLVRPTAAWYRRYHGAQLAGILGGAAVALALILVFTLSFVRNSQALARTSVDGCRPIVEPPPLNVRLVPLEDCREAIESLTPQSRWARVSLNFGLRHTDRLEGELRQRYVAGARRDVLDPVQARIDKKLVPGPEAPAYVAALLDRIQLVARCRAGGCDAFGDWVSPRYAAMLVTDLPGEAEPTIARLARTHAAVLRWQGDAAALELRGADADRVTRWIRAGGLRSDWILASASTRFPAVRLKDFWGVEGPSLVDGAYTARAWNDALAPLIGGLRAIAAEQVETATELRKFETDYRRDGQRQWQAFLQAFPQGERLAGGRRPSREFVGWMVKPDSPYRRMVDAVVTNVKPLVPDPQADVPAWARTVVRYAELRARLAEVQKLPPEEAKARLKQHEREAAANLAAYSEATELLRVEMAPAERAYRSALRVFDEGEPGARSTHPIQKALWAVRNLKGVIGAEGGDDALFWLLFVRPIELSWRGMLDEAGMHVQQQWEAVWPELAAPETAPAQRASRVIAFVNDKLGSVLERRGDRYAARTMFGEGIPFTGDFLQYLATARQFSPTGSARLEPPRLIVSTF